MSAVLIQQEGEKEEEKEEGGVVGYLEVGLEDLIVFTMTLEEWGKLTTNYMYMLFRVWVGSIFLLIFVCYAHSVHALYIHDIIILYLTMVTNPFFLYAGLVQV